MKMRLGMAAAVIVALGTATAAVTPASAGPGIAVGVLSCNVSSGWGFVFGSSRSLNCTLAGANGVSEHYTGAISKFGADLGYTEGGVLVWTVFAPQANLIQGAIAGSYAGGRERAPRWASGWAPMGWSADRAIRSHCSRSAASKAIKGSMSPPASLAMSLTYAP